MNVTAKGPHAGPKPIMWHYSACLFIQKSSVWLTTLQESRTSESHKNNNVGHWVMHMKAWAMIHVPSGMRTWHERNTDIKQRAAHCLTLTAWHQADMCSVFSSRQKSTFVIIVSIKLQSCSEINSLLECWHATTPPCTTNHYIYVDDTLTYWLARYNTTIYIYY